MSDSVHGDQQKASTALGIFSMFYKVECVEITALWHGSCQIYVYLVSDQIIVDKGPSPVSSTSPKSGEYRHVQVVQLYNPHWPLCGQWFDHTWWKGRGTTKGASVVTQITLHLNIPVFISLG